MIRQILIVVSLLGLLNASVAQIVQNGQCDQNIELAQDFDIEEFLGTWYEIARSANPIQGGDCSQIELSRENITQTLLYNNRAVNRNFLEVVTGTFVSDANNAARLTLNLNDGGTSGPLDFWILFHQLNSSVAYRCENISPTQRRVYIWQIARATTPATAMVQALIDTLLERLFGFNTTTLESVDHSESACYELPLIEAGQHVELPGQCDNSIPVVQNFNVAAFTGEWHEIASYYSANAQGACPRAQYTLEGSTVFVQNSQVINQALDTISGTATVSSVDGSARLEVTLEVSPSFFVTQELLVIATDYTNYAISYTCENVNNTTKRVNSWILGRSRQLSSTTQAAVDAVVHSIMDLNYAYYEDAARSDNDCFYYPEVVPDETVIFRGQCDLNIPAMPNFDAARYMGLWHDIESYPSSFQQGTCNNAFYTLNITPEGPVVDVFNTQVVGQTLDTINGQAILAADDGTAKLTVSFPIAGTNLTTKTSYWVLDTDYDTYALVYTCENINEDSRIVFSWKLSRTKQLTQAAQTQISNIVNSIPVLDQRYFAPRDQSVAGCFYFPEPVPGQTVVFPGQCEENLDVVANFNMQNFQGTWYEVEAYPKEFQPGECVAHEYTQGTGTTLNLQSSSIVDQFQQVSTSNVTFSSTDNSARLVITLSDGIQIPFWILATDYNDYALAYSCVNINSDFRSIYSWKLSKTRSLSVNANNAINNVINNVVTLDNIYYETIDQSDDACFYLPVLGPGEPVILPGQCDPNLSVVTNFNAVGYSGLWHLIESYPSAFQDGDCNDATYTILNDGTVEVFNTQVINQTLDTITGSASLVASTDGSAKLIVTFPTAPDPIEYWVVATDYTSYSLVYSCVNINAEQRQVWSWKMSRTKTLSTEATTAINQIIDSVNVLNNAYYEVINNSDNACFYYPIADGGDVVFRGQCDLNIPAMPNFDAARYMGLWHDIESYPSQFQQGTCNNAFYTLNITPEGPVVDVFNTQVVGQTLDTINGQAVLAADDGTAKLTVSFPIAGTNLTTDTSYWVLDTDYDTYALVYTCENINEDSRLVYSWKLSRTKQLTQAAQTQISNVVNSIPVLDQRYFAPRDQSIAGCFYFPEPVPGQTVVFPGQCEENLDVVANFNVQNFQGTWYEVEAYPKEFQPGECVAHEYTQGTGTTLNLQSSSIVDQFQLVSTSNVTFASTDNSARLVITISDGTQIPFWILATDYNDYALAYSCVNINSDFRSIYSWKLSKTRSLSVNANNAINNVINNVVTLDNIYYETIDQSDDACFYLPVLGPGEPVIFPGQCDPNLSVVTNFNAVGYSGLWHLIESYPSAFQDGDCNDATYTILNDGTVEVFNTQVINQTLDTITGSASLVASTDGSAKLIVTFPTAPDPIEYWVVATDYTSYSLVYSCVNINAEQRQVWSWKMSRTKTLSTEATTAINQNIDSVNVLNNAYYEVINNSDNACFYYPIADGGDVVFRGQCDLNIPAMPNFDAARYMGLWHDIESYPSQFQQGTCNNAFYTLNITPEGPVVDVFNTQVVGQTLDTINGQAVLAADDGTAKLTVSFPIAGTNLTTETSYWVLETDYDTYALVYTCENINEDSRFVFSWKLSRTKQLTQTAQTQISNIVNSIPVLDQRYFAPRDQSVAGCFYFPEPVPGQTVVFPGQCDNTIPVVSNFNLTEFQGTWYEIEAYPKDFQPGQCISHEYSTGTGNTLNLQTSSVDSQSLQTSSSTLSFTSTDNSARLQITLDNGIVIPFWILGTDYSGYALAYSCVNINSDFRSIYSWKLSRTNSLSTTANTAINTIVSNVVTLGDEYYEPINQSDEACFFLPELSPNEPVVFVGQCDVNIPVVTSFNVTAFAGRWFDIESYFDDYQGDCIDGRFTVSADVSNEYDVLFTQVVNQELDSTTSRATVAVDGSGRLTVTTNNVSFDYWILDTDYVSYALVYSCNNLSPETRRVRSWKMSRDRQLTDAARTAIANVVNSINVLDERYFNVRDHTVAACFYYPEPVPGQTVLFRGECDQAIPVVQNFNVGSYLGEWFDIESYPQQFQDGTCATATYTLGTEGVDVYNTQVVAQQLDTINGLAVVDSNEGEGKLLVSFPIAGTNLTTQTPYWILATDYTTFSLVYSCNRVDDEYRSVSAWKLSRTRNLTTAAQNTINVVMSNIPVLRQQYFEETGHTEEDCFFYPDNNGGPVILEGQCPGDNETGVITNFNSAAFAGQWHEIARFPSELQAGECAASQFTPTGTNAFNLTQTAVINEALQIAIGPAVVSTDGRGIISATIGAGEESADLDLHILDTDYNSFALAYSCVNIDENRKQIYSWKLGRSRDGLSQAANDRIDQAVSNNIDLFEGYYEPTNQTNDGCFYYPEFDTLPNSIVLPGPCDESIQGIANFNVGEYLGRWFEIARYPQPFQTGECSRAEYSLVNGNVEVDNTQVVDQTLDSQIGSAVVASDDGSGVLDVNFTVNGENVTANYYILATDYTSYSLVYSCRNLNDGNRQVSSWKLSRSRTLSDQANQVMDQVIENTQGLRESYYSSTTQTDDACFYIPEVVEDSAPLFRGACQEITGVANFNIQLYLGWWHEIERYPVTENIGECISSQFSAVGSTFNVVDTNVVGEVGNVETAAVTVTTDGRITRTYSDGRVVVSWVLATDYQTYSLLYSCENYNNSYGDQYRRVWSAKHSKERQLTQEAQNAMATYITGNQVLYPQFYQDVSQTEDACFYYPDPASFSGRVILPGQCASNVQVVEQFDAGQYSGIWYQIERYPYPQVSDDSTCIGARYTYNENSELTVLNWEVVDDELRTMGGVATIPADGSARLTVTLQLNENQTTTTDLYIIATDYTAYTLAYTCENVNNFQRAIVAFKLSRSRDLPPPVNNTINTIMNGRPEFYQDYFITVEQDEECPNSGLVIRSSIIVILICGLIQLLR